MYNNPCVDHLGQHFNSKMDMAKAWNINYSTMQNRLSEGWSLEDVLTKSNCILNHDKPRIDHLGNEYPSFNEMCNAYNKTFATVNKRLERGWSLKDALTCNGKKIPDSMCECTDHLGNKYDTIKHMCEHYNIAYPTYLSRLKKGWTQEDALTKTLDRGGCTDHLGNHFENIKEMCKHYHISEESYHARIRKGASKEEALTTPAHTYGKPVITDHLGNIYPDKKTMANHYGFPNYSTIHSRLKKGMSLEQALTTKNRYSTKSNKSLNVEYDGQTFNTLSTLSEKTGIASNVLKIGLKNGFTIDEIKDFYNKGLRIANKIYDHKGNAYPSARAMCDTYGISYSMFKWRLKNHTLEEALTLPLIYEPLLNRAIKQRNGLTCTVIKYGTSKDIAIAEWEDGIISRINTSQLSIGKASHPTLKHYCAGRLLTFKTKPLKWYHPNDEIYYDCTCETCKHSFILTAHQMVEHSLSHTVSKTG